MTTAIETLPITSELAPENSNDLAEAVREAADNAQAIYPLGGRTALDVGLAPTAEGIGLSSAKLDTIVDFDPRDMTIIAESGVTMAQLAETLSAESQELPIDCPRASEATLGGVVATNWNGPRRYGRGTLRDYLIGVGAVDGRGVAFQGGGRVMKNVAGYDFPKLLTGSVGTLAVITQLTFKVRPKAEASAVMTCPLNDWDQVDDVLAAVNKTVATPTSVELLAGSAMREHFVDNASSGKSVALLVLHFEGSGAELVAMRKIIRDDWTRLDADAMQVLAQECSGRCFDRLVEFPDHVVEENGDSSALTVKITVPPSRVTAMCQTTLNFDPNAVVVAHAGNGIVLVRFDTILEGDAGGLIVGQLQPAAQRFGGSVVVLRSPFDGLTRQVVWGGRTMAHDWMNKVKQQFDPHGILNPGRLFY